MIDIHQILEYLPHRYPFLLIDRVVEFEKDTSLKAIKNVQFLSYVRDNNINVKSLYTK